MLVKDVAIVSGPTQYMSEIYGGLLKKPLSCHTFLPDFTSPNTHTHTLIDVGVQKVNERVGEELRESSSKLGLSRISPRSEPVSSCLGKKSEMFGVSVFCPRDCSTIFTDFSASFPALFPHDFCWCFRNPIPNHLGCIKPCKQRNKLSNLNWWVYRVSEASTASTTQDRNMNRVDQIAIIS